KDEHFFEDDDRHRILEAIEEQAKNMSMARGANQHRLSDWLNAAEEVMPEVKKPTVKPMSMAAGEGRSSSSTLMSVLLGGTLLLTLAGVGGFGFYQLNQQVQSVSSENAALKEKLVELETNLKELAEVAEKASNKSEVTLSESVAPAVAVNSVSDVATTQATNPPASSVESLLDARFKQLIELLDQRMRVQSPAPIQPIAPLTTSSATTNLPLQAPTVTEPTAPVIAEMAVGSTQNSATGAKDAHPNQWLFDLPKDALVIQLGSSVKADAFSEMMKKIRQQPELARVLPVTANGSTRYVLTYGGFTSRDEARKASERLKLELGVSPWIRKASDVQQLADKP
ncbi:MAG TPA: SPOR domain-containing protein, partial [Thiotrichales bacterium]|nr:SPOR domain-containing protein [Thiotrichales bacterium]